MNKILKILKNKESYIQRKSRQLNQWERVINILRIRADKSKIDIKSELRAAFLIASTGSTKN